MKEYADAGHGFLNDHGPGEVPALFLIMGRAMHAAHHQACAEDARQRIVSFFRTHLQ